MKKYLVLLAVINFLIYPQSSNREFRSTWVITWEYISGSRSVEQNKATIRQILDNHKRANMTSVLWQVRQAGTAYYNSSFEPWGSYAGGVYPGFDPLEYAIEEAHKRGLELHAWFNVFACGSTVAGTPAQVHPEWICRDQNGNPMTTSIALAPGIPEVRNYLVQVAMEVVRNYDIDGIHWDYVRWNEYSSKEPAEYPPGLPEEYKQLDGFLANEDKPEDEDFLAGRYLYTTQHPYSAGVPAGFSSWEEWWRYSVTEYVRTVNDSIKAVKPWVRISAAALGKYNWTSWQGYGTVYQDAALWFNNGYLDQLTPMHYHWTTGSGFYGMLAGSCPQCWSQFIQPGINAGRLYSVGPGSYILSDNNVWNNHPEVINSVRSLPWTDGFQFFSYGSWQDHEYWETAANTFFKRKTKIRATGLVSDSIPASPSVTLQKTDSLNYILNVVPPVSDTGKNWYVVYRSENDLFDLNQSEIIDIKFGNAPFQISINFTGLQDFNGKYRYAATTCNRFWNESSLSNIAVTDSVPSFAPTVVATLPADNDTVNINTILKIDFSKKMNKSDFINSVSSTPSIPVSSLTWSNEDKTVQLNRPALLNYGTQYIVTILPTAKDINGKALDGDGNGVPGDSFSFTFRTTDVDTSGPVIVKSFPDSNSAAGFDVESVMSFEFDELINPATITHSNVILKKGVNSLSKDMRLTNVNNKSILSLKTTTALTTNTSYSITLTQGIKDVNNNTLDAEVSIPFTTSGLQYDQIRPIDDFSTDGSWQQPGYSGSTVGIVDSGSYWALSNSIFLPASSPAMAAYLNYQWQPGAATVLLREYLSGGTPRDVTFDTSYTMQVYLFGDASGNKFRFAIDEGNGTLWPNHEVSKWFTIDWSGWRLVEWELGDPSSVGSWIGNGVLDYPLYRVDSFQMTKDNSSAVYGRIYLDNFRVVKKSIPPVYAEENMETAGDYFLQQNFPNPFNPCTTIPFTLKFQTLIKLQVFDYTGSLVRILYDGPAEKGNHSIDFCADNLASGIYFINLKVLENGNVKNYVRKLTLLK